MVLAGGVLIAGCSGSEKLGPDGTGGGAGAGAGGVGGAGGGGAPVTANTGATPAQAGRVERRSPANTGAAPAPAASPFPCGNASSDPCICGRPDASSAAAEACSELTACEAAGGVWRGGLGAWGTGGQCKSDDGGVLEVDGATAHVDGGARD